jgi:hypothetical protein
MIAVSAASGTVELPVADRLLTSRTGERRMAWTLPDPILTPWP